MAVISLPLYTTTDNRTIVVVVAVGFIDVASPSVVVAVAGVVVVALTPAVATAPVAAVKFVSQPTGFSSGLDIFFQVAKLDSL